MISRRVSRLSVRRVAKVGGISIAHWSSRICATTSFRAWSASTKTSGSLNRDLSVIADQVTEACDGAGSMSERGPIENGQEALRGAGFLPAHLPARQRELAEESHQQRHQHADVGVGPRPVALRSEA